MEDNEAKNIVDEVFNKVEEAKSITELKTILQHPDLRPFKMDTATYPELGLAISNDEIQKLKSEEVLTAEGDINHNNISSKENSALVKLMYAFLWKQGDLKKVKHVVAGIENDEDDPGRSSGFVLHQFGRYLGSESEPIIDQHVLRAFAIYSEKEYIKIAVWRKKSLITKKDIELIERYKKWLKSDKLKILLKEVDAIYHIDQILFALGKAVKNGKK